MNCYDIKIYQGNKRSWSFKMRTSVVSGYSLQPLGNPTLPLANHEWCQQYGTENHRSSLVSNVSSIFQRLVSRTHFLSSTPHPRWRCSMLRSMQRVTWVAQRKMIYILCILYIFVPGSIIIIYHYHYYHYEHLIYTCIIYIYNHTF